MTRLRIGHLSTFYHTAILLMADAATNERLDADVEWRLFGTGPAIVNAFERKELDCAYIGLPPAVIGIERGVGIRCVAGGHIEGTVISAKGKYRGSSGAENLGAIFEQFRGLRIGVPGRGSIHDVILTECLRRFGLDGDIEVINFQWADQVTEAVVKDEVAAAVGTPALAVALMRYAGGKVLYPPSRLWPFNPSYGIVVSGDLLHRDPEVVERFLLLHEEATALLRTRPARAAEIISNYVGFIDKEFVLDTIGISPKYCSQLSAGYVSSTMEFVGAMRKLGYLKRDIGEDEIFDASLIRRVHPPGDHYGGGKFPAA